jgi:hypothetical protein
MPFPIVRILAAILGTGCQGKTMKTRAKPLRFRGSFGAILLLPLGLGMLLLGIAAPIMLARTPDGDPWLAFALLSLPCLVVGAIALLNGIAAAATRIEIDADGVSIRAPAWRGAPFPPARTFRANWSEVTAVRRRVESYSLLGLPFPVVVHQVRAGERCVVLGGTQRVRTGAGDGGNRRACGPRAGRMPGCGCGNVGEPAQGTTGVARMIR